MNPHPLPLLPRVSALDVVERLKRACEARGLSRRLVRACGLRQWDAPCPAHADRHPSLRMYEIDGTLYFRCYAGCHFNDVRRALGLPAGAGDGAGRRRDDWRHRGPAEPRPEPLYNFEHLAKLFAADAAGAAPLAERLGVSAASLVELAAGRAVAYPMYVRSRDCEMRVMAWTFPMRDAAGDVCGLRMRSDDGTKFSFTSSVPGLFLPTAWGRPGPLLVVEGPTDAAAALDWCYDVVGRPSCNDGDELVAGLLGKLGRRDVVILFNADAAKRRADGTSFYPGQEGAEALAGRVRWSCRTLRTCPPPAGMKDARQWLADGATRADVDAVIGARGTWRPEKVRR